MKQARSLFYLTHWIQKVELLEAITRSFCYYRVFFFCTVLTTCESQSKDYLESLLFEMMSILTRVNEWIWVNRYANWFLLLLKIAGKVKTKRGSVQIWGFTLKQFQFAFFQEPSFNIQLKCGLTYLAGKTKSNRRGTDGKTQQPFGKQSSERLK